MSALMQFQQHVLACNRAARHQGLPDPVTGWLVQKGANPLCGDHLAIYLRIDENVLQARYHGEMSAITQAAAELLCRGIAGASTVHAHRYLQAAHALLQAKHTPNEIDLRYEVDLPYEVNLGEFSVFAVLRDYPVRIKTATLPILTLQAAMLRLADPGLPEQVISSE